jgi:hypothetical protein
MNEILVNIGRLSVYTLSLFTVIGYFWYSFVLYKKGLEFRYSGETLLDLAILSGVFGWIGARIGYVLSNLGIFKINWLRIILLSEYPGYNYLGLVVGLILAVLLLSRREEIKFFEGLDLMGLGLSGASSFERLGRVFSGRVNLVLGLPIELLQALAFLLIFVWLWRLEKDYRTFDWYRFRKTQARPGFIFGAYLFLTDLLVLTSSIWPTVSLYGLILGGAGLIGGVVVIYSQSGRSLAHDVKLLPIISRWYT